MSKSIVLIERVDQIDLLKGCIDENTVVVSLHPSVFLELNKRKIPCQNTLHLFGIEGHRTVQEKTNEIIEGLRPLLSNMKVENIKHAFEKTWVFYFRFHLLYLLSIGYIIHQAVLKNKADKLIIINEDSLIDSAFEKKYCLSEIVKEYGALNNIEVGYTKKRLNSRIKKPNFIFFKKLFSRIIFEFQLIIFKSKFKKKGFILALEDTYSMPDFLNDAGQSIDQFFPVYLRVKSSKVRLKEMMKGESFCFLFLPSAAKSNTSANLQNKLEICILKINSYFNKNPELLKISGLNLSTFLIDYIKNTLNIKMHSLCGELVSLKRVLDIAKPSKVFSQHCLGLGYILGEVSLELGIPALLISHGSHVPNANPIAQYEWSIHSHTIINSHYPFVSVQTPWAEKFLKMQDNLTSIPINTGPLLTINKKKKEYNKLKLREKIFGKLSNKNIILHASTPKDWNNFRPWIYETADEYVRNINDVITAVEKIPGVYLAVRFRPDETLSLKDFKMSLVVSNCYGIYDEGDFEDYLIASNFLLSYSSTAIEQSLHYNLPVIQYEPDGKYEHIKAEVLKYNGNHNISTIYSVMSQEDLRPALKWLNENHQSSNNINLLWSEHTFNYKNNMNWLNKMDLTKS